MVYKIVVSMVLKDVKNKVNVVILELIMDVEVVILNDYVGNVIGDIISCCGCLES